MNLTSPVTLTHDSGGFVAECPDIPGCISQGDTREDAMANIREAITLCLPEIIRAVTKGRPAKAKRRPTQAGREIVYQAGVRFKVAPFRITGREKWPAQLVDARQWAALKMRERGWSYPRIAVELGRKDHTSAWHLVNVRELGDVP